MSLFSKKFTSLLGAVTVANLADGVVLLAIPLTAVAMGADAWLVAIITACIKLPWLFFGLVAGAACDRYSRIGIARAAALARILVLLAFSITVASQDFGPVWLAIGAILLGICEVFYDTASQTLIPAIVSRKDLVRANSYTWSAQSLSNEFVGPPLGGILVAAALWAPFLLGTLSYAIVALVMIYLSSHLRLTLVHPDSENEGFTRGIAYILRHIFLRRLTAYLAAIYLTFGVWMGLLVFYLVSVSNLQLTSTEVGLLMGVSAIGGVLGSQMASVLILWIGEYLLLATGAVGWAIFMIGPLASDNFFVAASLMAFGSIFGTAMGVSSFALRQLATPPSLLGRVSSVYRLVTWGSIPLGNVIGGLFSSVIGVTQTMVGATVIMFILVPISLFAFHGRASPKALGDAGHST